MGKFAELGRAVGILNDSISCATAYLDCEFAAKWDRKYINSLPNAAFAVVEKGYKEGGSKNARHLP